MNRQATAAGFSEPALITILYGPRQMRRGPHPANNLEIAADRLWLQQRAHPPLSPTNVQLLVRSGIPFSRTAAVLGLWHRVLLFRSASGRPISKPLSSGSVQTRGIGSESWSAPCRSMPSAVRDTRELLSRPAHRQIQWRDSSQESARSESTNPQRSGSNLPPQTIRQQKGCHRR